MLDASSSRSLEETIDPEDAAAAVAAISHGIIERETADAIAMVPE